MWFCVQVLLLQHLSVPPLNCSSYFYHSPSSCNSPRFLPFRGVPLSIPSLSSTPLNASLCYSMATCAMVVLLRGRDVLPKVVRVHASCSVHKEWPRFRHVSLPRCPLGANRLRRKHPPALLRQLRPGLGVRVEESEVADDDRNRKGDGQNPGQGTDRPDEHPDVRLRGHVAVPHRRHGNDGPPQSDGDRREVVGGIVLNAFGVEDQRGEDDDAEDEEEDEQGQLVSARLERVDEDLQTGGVPGQLEQSHDADDAEELEDLVLLVELRQKEVQVEGHGGDGVDDVDRRSDEAQAVRTGNEANGQLEGEPGVAGALDVEEGRMRVRRDPLQVPADHSVRSGDRRDVPDEGDAKGGVCLQTEHRNGDEDEEDGGRGNHLHERTDTATCRQADRGTDRLTETNRSKGASRSMRGHTDNARDTSKHIRMQT